MQEFTGKTASVADKKFAIVVSNYYENITHKLLEGAIKTLTTAGVAESNIATLWTPGSWELPAATLRVLKSGKFDGVVILGCVIKGETTHDQHINTAISNGIAELTLQYDVPIGFGLLTCNTLQQALDRSGGSVGNKGVEAAEAAVHMSQVFAEFATMED
jgi:6,7-dimethyl-8-ribityllumazine synthase